MQKSQGTFFRFFFLSELGFPEFKNLISLRFVTSFQNKVKIKTIKNQYNE